MQRCNAEVQLWCAESVWCALRPVCKRTSLSKQQWVAASWTGFHCKHLTGDVGKTNTCGCAGLSLLAWLLPHHSGVIITPTQPIIVQNFKSNQIVPPVKLFLTAKLPSQLTQSKLVAVASFSLMTLLLQEQSYEKMWGKGRGAEDPPVSLPVRKVIQGLRLADFQWAVNCSWGCFPFLGNQKRKGKTEGAEHVRSKPADAVASYYRCLD